MAAWFADDYTVRPVFTIPAESCAVYLSESERASHNSSARLCLTVPDTPWEDRLTPKTGRSISAC
jgi:hypothetical protein